MTVISGTAGADVIDVSGSGDIQVLAGAGDDTITIVRGTFETGTLTVDAGDGDDRIKVTAYNWSPATVHGGAGADTFDLFGGGVVYGDAGADVFRVQYPTAIPRFTIADFSAEDRLDLTPYLAGMNIPAGTDPFAAGYVRLSQAGADTSIEALQGGWFSLGLLANQDATKLTAAQIGFTPVVAASNYLSMSVANTTVWEGGKIVVDLTIGAPLDKAVRVGVSSSSFAGTVSLAAGQTKAQLVLYVPDDGAAFGDWTVTLTATGATGLVIDPHTASSVATITIKENDAAGFSVGGLDASSLYKTMTLLSAVPASDGAALSAFTYSSTSRDKIRVVEPFAISTTSVALTAYQFFTGKSPSQAGLTYLVNSPDNASDLNDAGGVYAGMNTENRYINFAANLGLVGEGKAAFSTAYKALSFREAVEKAYDTVIGKAQAAAAGIDVAKAIDGVVASSAYFDALATQRMGGFDHDLAMKAGMIGYLIAEGQKAHVGIYARAVENFYLDLTDGTAQHNVDLVAVYGPGTFLDAM